MTEGGEADHVLVIFDQPLEYAEREIHRVYGPLRETEARQLVRVLSDITPLYYEIKPIEPAPLALTNAGRRSARGRTTS